MRKLHILGALLAVLATCAAGATSAFAADEWLVNGNLIALGGSFPVVTKGTWLWLALSFGGFTKTHVVCEGELLGTANGLNAAGHGTGTVTEVHNLTLTQLKTVTCEVLSAEKGPCSTSLALVTALNLPWNTELVLKSGDTSPRDLFTSSVSGKEPGFNVSCASGTGTFEESCEGNVETEQLANSGKNVAGEIKNQLTKSCKGFGNVMHIYATGEAVEEKGGELAVG
jgi:hypothetical protein